MQNFQFLKPIKVANVIKRPLVIILTLILTVTVLYGQNSNGSNSVDVNNLSKIKNLSKTVRDSLVIELKKKKTLPINYTINGIEQKIPSNFKHISLAMNNLIISILENPESEKIEENQKKIHELIKQMDQKMEDLNYEIERQQIIAEYKNNSYSDKSEKREAKKEMQEDLRELKQERKEQKEILKEGKS